MVVCDARHVLLLILILCPVLQMGHMPQEDYAEAIQKTISKFLQGIKS